jgi:TRAP-type C4-dicarboxylate transport system permease small subunit
MKILTAINTWIARVETAILVLVLSIMVLLAFFQVVLRNVFDQGLLWGDIFLRHLVLWVGFLGASLATRDEKHISIDILTRFLGKKWQPLSRVITYLFSMVVCWYLAQAAITFVSDEISFKTVAFGDVPAWYFQIIIPIGFFMMMIRFFILALQNTVRFFQKKQDDE